MTKKILFGKGIIAVLEKEHAATLEKTEHFHDVLVNLRYEGKPSYGKNIRQTRDALKFFDSDWAKHVDFEEKTLFPFLEVHIPKLESVLGLLRSEHDEFRQCLWDFRSALRELSQKKSDTERGKLIEKIREIGIYLVYLLRHHARAESKSIYKMMGSRLRPDEKRDLSRRIGRKA